MKRVLAIILGGGAGTRLQPLTSKPPRSGESEADKAKRKSFKARHAKNIAKGKMSAAYWANREKW